MTRGSRASAWLAVGWLALIGWVTLGPAPWRTRPAMDDYDVLSPATWLDDATWTRLSSGEFVANILLFVPLGMLLRLTLPRATWLGAAALGGVVSLGVEILQMWTPRVSDPRDLLANTAGAAVGALVAAVAARVVGAGRRARERELAGRARVGR